jgi:hypothetical protein
MNQFCVQKLITIVSNITCTESNEAALCTELDCVLILITYVTNVTCTESHEAALCTELDYKRHQHNVHRVA